MMLPIRARRVRWRRFRRVAVIGLGAAFALAASTAGAVGAPSQMIVTVVPASGPASTYFKISTRAGRSIPVGILRLENPSATPIAARLDPVDGQTASTLGSVYAMPGSAANGAALWLRLSHPRVTIPPRSIRTVAVGVVVPRTAFPGDYLSGVSVEALGQRIQSSSAKGPSIASTERYAIGVEVRVPGARRALIDFTRASIERQPSGLVFQLSASNAGNVILQGVHGWARVTSGSRVVAARTIQPGTFVSGTSISYPLPTPREQPAEGTTYRVRAALYYDGRVARIDTNVVFGHAAAVIQQRYGGRKLAQPTPWWVWAILALSLIAALIGAVLLLRRRRRPLTRAAGLRLLERSLAEADGRSEPVSIALVTCRSADSPSARAIGAAIQPRLRRADRTCEIAPHQLLVICPATSRRAAAALGDDLTEHFARHPELAGTPIEITTATAATPLSADALLDEAKAAAPRHRPDLDTAFGNQAVTTRER